MQLKPDANRQAAEGATQRRVSLIHVGIFVLIVCALATRLGGPWRIEVTNDEMIHLQSWRNCYGTADVFPIFIKRLQELPARSALQERIMRIYRQVPLSQYALLVIVDGHPPLFPATMEVVRAATNSSLVAERFVSTAASLGSILAAWLIGRRLKDGALALWLATLYCISAMCQYYGGIARPYATGEFVLLLAILAFIRDVANRPKSPGRFLCFALLAQSVVWFNWVTVGVLVIAALARRWRSGAGLLRLVRQTLWYGAASLLLLAYQAVQRKNPTLGRTILGTRPLYEFWQDFSAISPFSHLGRFGAIGFSIAGAIFALLIGGGVWRLSRDPSYRAIRWPMLTALLFCLVLAYFVPTSPRLLIPLAVVPTIAAAICLRSLAGRSATAVALATLVGFCALSIVAPVDPYARHLYNEDGCSTLARELAREIKPGDTWIAYPYFLADRMYRFASLPAPLQPQSPAQFSEMVRRQTPGHACYLVTQDVQLRDNPDLAAAKTVLASPHGLVILMRLPP